MATSAPPIDPTVSLDDKYARESGRVFITATQALVRLPMMQRQRDIAAGLNTAGYVTGYRGSPLGGLDQAMWRAKTFLKANHIHFQPGVNEDLAATAVWGTQQVNMFEGAKYDGVFSMWYGKGPGVDRSGDVFRHGNLAGTARHGGVLLLAGDDHAAKSSTVPHQSEHVFIGTMIPVLNPAGVQEFLDLGLYGWAMSRYSGCWVAFKCTAETTESSASVHVDPDRVQIARPNDFEMPEGGLNIRWPDHWTDQEYRLQHYKNAAALAFARANRLDRVVMDSPKARFGIVTTGKAYLDVRQALADLGIDEAAARALGIRLYKVALTWPLEPEGARQACEGLDEVLVVEEKRAIIETQLKEQLYNWRAEQRPRIVGKVDENRALLLSSGDELSPTTLAALIASRLGRMPGTDAIKERAAAIARRARAERPAGAEFKRTPYFCSGCPHNTSTKVPEGSRASAGIGCHFMTVWMDRRTSTFTQMGGEGCTWIGQSPFTETRHIFANIGDGTYFHSGLLAIRAACAAKVTMTYKILYNDAVAMTGGQPLDGQLTVPQIAAQVLAEGVRRVVVTSDDPDKYPVDAGFPPGVEILHRSELDRVQRELREEPGVTVLIHDQTCAAEKRRRRKRGTFPDPDKRVFINSRVCEGCGDCGVAANCLSLAPLETEFGRKRVIDQSSCNKDFSCVNGFCPSFVTVHGAKLRKLRSSKSSTDPFAGLPEPRAVPRLEAPYNILVTGVGGTGVVTIGALLGMAAHLEGKGVTILDQTGLAQKGGAVHSHIRLAPAPEQLHAVRIAAGEADLLLGCDLVVSASAEAMERIRAGRTRAIVNVHESPTGEFTRNPDLVFPVGDLQGMITHVLGGDAAEFFAAQRLATKLLGDSIATNPFLLGYAWQKGFIPLSRQSIERAIELNDVAIEANKRAFSFGRLAAHDRRAVERVVLGEEALAPRPLTLAEIVARRVADLTDYQDGAYARRYEDLVRRVEKAESERVPGQLALTTAVARYAYKLMAYKDEYEVARLYSRPEFRKALSEQFEDWRSLEFHLAPPLVAERDPATGHLRKRSFGPWLMTGLRMLAGLRRLRGTRLDPFGRTAERRMERKLIDDYEALLEEIAAQLRPGNHAVAVELAAIPEKIRGYGHVKERHLAEAKTREAALLKRFRAPPPMAVAAE
ncbi:MAG: indolepyruvate ferredoxin oxidoreductase family protein [Alphaproteobacteria bacterium]|nr:indolepyruvate ferredoxin oxidoreductase family protein [Alphaproteobacteria bacterium]